MIWGGGGEALAQASLWDEGCGKQRTSVLISHMRKEDLRGLENLLRVTQPASGSPKT